MKSNKTIDIHDKMDELQTHLAMKEASPKNTAEWFYLY